MIYQSILTEAAEKSKAQEARALAIEKQRRQELHEMAREMDLKMDRRRKRNERVLTWDSVRPTIEEMKGQGSSDAEIAKGLCDQGFSTCRREVYRYTVDNGLPVKPENGTKFRKIDPFRDYVIEQRKKGAQLKDIANHLSENGVSVNLTYLSKYIKKESGNEIDGRLTTSVVLAEHHQFIQELVNHGLTYDQIFIKLKNKGALVPQYSIGRYCRKEGIKKNDRLSA